MLERIHNIEGIGLLHHASGSAFGLKKATLIYADNGLGKSTLASIIRSCSINDSNLILRRKTIDGVNDPKVVLQFDNGQTSTFQNGNWDNSRPEFLVFDSDFVEQNVYAGGNVSADQRRNLLQFALGESAVLAQREYDQADENSRASASELREIVSKLEVLHNGLTLSQFKLISDVPDAEEQIATLNERIIDAQNISSIQAKALPQKLVEPELNIDSFFRIISTSLENIDLEAEQKVMNHINSHNKPNLEKWVSDGHDFGEEENCLFCNQSLEGVQLIEAYRSYFNNDYNQLKSSVAQLDSNVAAICSEGIVYDLKAKFSTASAVIDGWQEHLSIVPPEFDDAKAIKSLRDIRGSLEILCEAKKNNLLESIGTEEDKRNLTEKWNIIIDVINECNNSIEKAIKEITSYKENLASVNIEDLKLQIRNLEWSKIRHRQEVLNLLVQYDEALANNKVIKQVKEEKKDSLNQIMQATLMNYKDRINQLLRGFGAQFTIPNIDFNYRGGLSSDYGLQMRGSNISLSGGIPDFKTSLSESDKRTLAFAFFIASAESDINLANKIILIDDPMSSLDLNRKQQTRIVLKRLHDNCEQIIIMAHDIHFLRNFQEDVIRSANPQDVRTIRFKSVSNRYSDFDTVDLKKECESSYFRAHRILCDYKNGNTSSKTEVARSIRPMLEGYLHRRFPGLINEGLLFGKIIQAINRAQTPSPLVYAKNITNELNQINQYAGQFHHDTNPAADQVQIVDGELLSFVERAINVVYTGEVVTN